MQADVQPFLAFDMHLCIAAKSLLFRHLRLSIGAERGIFGFSVDDVVTGAGRDTLGKFAAMVRHQLPTRFLLNGRMDRDLYTVQWPVIRPIGGAKDQGVWLLRLFW